MLLYRKVSPILLLIYFIIAILTADALVPILLWKVHVQANYFSYQPDILRIDESALSLLGDSFIKGRDLIHDEENVNG